MTRLHTTVLETVCPIRATLFGGLLISSTLFYTHGDGFLALVGFVASAAAFLSIMWTRE